MTDANRYTYRIEWADEHSCFVGTCPQFPSLSWMAATGPMAYAGIRRLVSETVEDMENNGECPPDKKSPHIGSSFDSFLKEEGIYKQATFAAVKNRVVYQIRSAMDHRGMTESDLAKSLGTSRSQVHRILDPRNFSMTLETLSRVAEALDLEYVFCLRPPSTNSINQEVKSHD